MMIRMGEGSLAVGRMEGRWKEKVTAKHSVSDLLYGPAYC